MKLMRAKPLQITSVENFWIVLLVVFLPELDRSCIWCDEDDATKKRTQWCRKDWSGQSLKKKHSRVWKLQVKVTQMISLYFQTIVEAALWTTYFHFVVVIYFTKEVVRKGKEGRQRQIAHYQHVIGGSSMLYSCNGGDMFEQSTLLAGWPCPISAWGQILSIGRAVSALFQLVYLVYLL